MFSCLDPQNHYFIWSNLILEYQLCWKNRNLTSHHPAEFDMKWTRVTNSMLNPVSRLLLHGIDHTVDRQCKSIIMARKNCQPQDLLRLGQQCHLGYERSCYSLVCNSYPSLAALALVQVYQPLKVIYSWAEWWVIVKAWFYLHPRPELSSSAKWHFKSLNHCYAFMWTKMITG